MKDRNKYWRPTDIPKRRDNPHTPRQNWTTWRACITLSSSARTAKWVAPRVQSPWPGPDALANENFKYGLIDEYAIARIASAWLVMLLDLLNACLRLGYCPVHF